MNLIHENDIMSTNIKKWRDRTDLTSTSVYHFRRVVSLAAAALALK